MSASIWFYYEEICYDARSHERKNSPTYVQDHRYYIAFLSTLKSGLDHQMRGNEHCSIIHLLNISYYMKHYESLSRVLV